MAELAKGDPQPAWPLPGVSSAGKPKPRGSFGASRGPGKWHAGVDLGAPEGSIVAAMEPGRVVNLVRGWANIYDPKSGDLLAGDTARLLVQGDSGLVVNYTAIGIDSWKEFGLGKGDRVEKGEPLARIGRYPGGDTMLHLETYREGTRDNVRWAKGEDAPPQLLDPTDYIERSKASASIEMEPEDVRPDVPPRLPPTPRPGTVGAGLGVVVVVLLVAYALGK